MPYAAPAVWSTVCHKCFFDTMEKGSRTGFGLMDDSQVVSLIRADLIYYTTTTV